MIENIDAIFKHITQGVYVISVVKGNQKNAFTAAWVMQVSFAPPLICFSINPEHHSYKILQESGICCISVLNNEQYIEASHFGQSICKDKMAGFQWQKTKTGSPALADSLAYFDCKVEHYANAGDHQLVICSIVDAAILNEGNPMLYTDTQDMDNSSELYKS
ncbi:MAG: flavin reductase family protein [Methylococcaceae bacterium]|nr:flavin reductase family protein [Methylococcaceae bacterium]